MQKICLTTGTPGQDGSYLSELLLEKGYKVYGIQRRTSTITTERIDHLLEPGRIETFYADLTDPTSLIRVIDLVKPDEIYNLASQSHVRVSFDKPVYTADVTALGPLRLLEIIRLEGYRCKFYQASSSEMWGITPAPQNEQSMFQPQSPYGISKLFAYWATKAYRTGYGMFACNGILTNHESQRRGRTFVTQKIVYGAVRIKLGKQNELRLGNLDALRDWGHSKDFVRAMYMIMQHSIPDDFVVATGYQHSVREFAERVFKQLGLDFNKYCKFDNQFLRPNEVPSLCGDSTKIRTILGWKPEITFDELIADMIEGAMKHEQNL